MIENRWFAQKNKTKTVKFINNFPKMNLNVVSKGLHTTCKAVANRVQAAWETHANQLRPSTSWQGVSEEVGVAFAEEPDSCLWEVDVLFKERLLPGSKGESLCSWLVPQKLPAASTPILLPPWPPFHWINKVWHFEGWLWHWNGPNVCSAASS